MLKLMHMRSSVMVVCASGKARHARRQEATKTTFHTILNARVKGGTMHMDADRRACCACKKSDHDTEVVHYFVLQPSLFKVAVPN